MKAYRGNSGIALHIRGTRWRCVVNLMLQAPAPGRNQCCALNMRLGGPQSWSGHWIAPIKFWTSDPPAHSFVTYELLSNSKIQFWTFSLRHIFWSLVSQKFGFLLLKVVSGPKCISHFWYVKCLYAHEKQYSTLYLLYQLSLDAI